MSDTQQLHPSKNDLAGYYIARERAALIKGGIEDGTAPFLPKDGAVAPTAIYNAGTGLLLGAKELVPAAIVKARNGYESNMVGSYYTSQKAGTQIKKDEKGIGCLFKGKDGQFHHSNLYFAKQMEQPERLQAFGEKNLKWKERLVGEKIAVISPEPVEYLAAYVAACKSGATLEVTPKAEELFKANMTDICENELKRGFEKNPAMPKLADVLFAAETKSTEIIKAREKELGIAQKPQEQKKNERRIDRSMAMSF